MPKSRTINLIIAGKDRVSKMLKRITGGLKKWGAGALKITGGLVAGFGAVTVALGVMFGKLAEQIDEQAKMASALGMQNEALGAIRDAAGYAGISISNLSTALRKMSQGVGDAANGTGEAKDAIEELGLDAKKLQQMSPEKAFTAIITELDKIPNGIKKTTLAMDLFGRSGAAMTNLTSKGLRQAQKDADTLGLKLTTAQAKVVESANDSWARIKIVGSDFLKYVTAKLAPGIKSGFDKAFEFIKSNDLQLWAAKAALGISVAFRSTLVVFGAVGEAVVGLGRLLNTVFSGLNNLSGWAGTFKEEEITSSLERVRQKIADLKSQGLGDDSAGQKRKHDIDSLREMETVLEEQLGRWTQFTDQAALLQKTFNDTGDALKEAQGFSQSDTADKTISGLDEMIAGLKSSASGLDEIKQKAESAETAMVSLTSKPWKIKLTGIEKLNIGGKDMLEGFSQDLADEADR